MSDIQSRIAAWQTAAFPDEMNFGSRYMKVIEEMAEWKTSATPDESADILITLYGYAAVCGFDLDRAVEDKFRRAQLKHPAPPTIHPTNTDNPLVNTVNALTNAVNEFNPVHNVLEHSRPSAEETWMEVARVIAKRGTCVRKQVGAVIVDIDGNIASTGYNGAPRGLPHCTDVGCINDTEDHGRCKRCVHAEANAIIQAGFFDTDGATIYVTTFPCIECAQLIINAGLKLVVYAGSYATQAHLTETVMELFDAADVTTIGLEND